MSTPEFAAVLPAYFFDPTFNPAGITLSTCSVYAFDNTLAAISGFDLTAKLANVAAPVLVMMGEGDLFGVEWGTDTTAAFPTTKPQPLVLAKCGHFWHECEPLFGPAWRSFLEQNALPE